MKLKITCFFVMLFFVFSCSKDDIETASVTINGSIQKGPFIQGSSVEISELDENLNPTGKQYKYEILSDRGDFYAPAIVLIDPIVEIDADGYYFNEVYGGTSDGTMCLKAIVNVSNTSPLCVNLLTHLEKDRVLLMIKEGETYEKSKETVQKELLQIFEIDTPIECSESCDITNQGDKDAILLAISGVFSSISETGKMMNLIGKFKADFLEDGEINDEEIQTILIDNAISIDQEKMRDKLQEKYADLDIDSNVPAFEIFLDNFIENSLFVNTIPKGVSDLISFNPDYTSINILQMEDSILNLEIDNEYVIQFNIDKLQGDLVVNFNFSSEVGENISEIFEPELTSCIGGWKSNSGYTVANDFNINEFVFTFKVNQPIEIKLCYSMMDTNFEQNVYMKGSKVLIFN